MLFFKNIKNEMQTGSVFNRTVLVRIAVIALALGLCYWSELVVGSRLLPNSISDSMHALFAPVNTFLQVNPHFANATLIAITLPVDIAGVGLIIWSIFGKTIRPFIGLCFIFGLRQTVEMLCDIPIPEGMIWRYPGFPSLLVDYHAMNDFFFSGHTAMVVYALAEISTLRRWWVTAIGVGCVLFVMAGLFSLRAHYTMDVYAGLVTPLLAFLIASSIAKKVDPFLEGKPT